MKLIIYLYISLKTTSLYNYKITSADGGNGKDGGDGLNGKDGENGKAEEVEQRLKECELEVQEQVVPEERVQWNQKKRQSISLFNQKVKINCTQIKNKFDFFFLYFNFNFYKVLLDFTQGKPGHIGGDGGCEEEGGQPRILGIAHFNNYVQNMTRTQIVSIKCETRKSWLKQSRLCTIKNQNRYHKKSINTHQKKEVLKITIQSVFYSIYGRYFKIINEGQNQIKIWSLRNYQILGYYHIESNKQRFGLLNKLWFRDISKNA